MSLGCMFGFFYCFYAYALHWGGYLRYNEVETSDGIYSGGRIITVMFCIMIGAMQLMGTMNHLKSIT